MTEVTWHARASLGLGSPVPGRLRVRTADERTTRHMGYTWHHTGAGGTLYKPNPIIRLRGIWEYHVHTLGYGDVAYNGAFDADANVYGLRDGQYVSAHAGSTGNVANIYTDGIVFLEDSRGITAGALAGFEWWVNLYRYVLHRTPGTYAHRWWAEGHGGMPTECPGDDWDRVVRFVGGNF